MNSPEPHELSNIVMSNGYQNGYEYVDETSDIGDENGINPEILGHIFGDLTCYHESKI